MVLVKEEKTGIKPIIGLVLGIISFLIFSVVLLTDTGLPNVSGKEVSYIEETLEEYSDTVEKGHIINSMPAANTDVEQGAVVVIIESSCKDARYCRYDSRTS